MLARDGAAYTGAVAALADRASAVRVESSSYTLLQQRNELSGARKTVLLKQVLQDSLRHTSHADLAAIDTNRKTKEVAISLQNYFIALQELAGSTAPADIGARTGELVQKLDDAMNAYNPSAFTLPISVAPVIIAGITEHTLRRELVSRKRTILNALDILDGLLVSVGREIDSQAKNIKHAKEALLVQQSYQDTSGELLSTASAREQWVMLRQKVMLGLATDPDDRKVLAEATTGGRKFRERFITMSSE